MAALTPTEELILDLLAARTRLGETYWTFSTRHRRALTSLQTAGLITLNHGITEHTLRAALTPTGRTHAMSATYTPPTPAPAAKPSLSPLGRTCLRSRNR